jgi:excisionase family DNA binding protein
MFATIEVEHAREGNPPHRRLDCPTAVPIAATARPQIGMDNVTLRSDRQAPQPATPSPEATDAPGRRPSSGTSPAGPRATLTVAEAAAVLGISRSAAYDLVHEGRIPALRLGRRIVVPAHDLDELLHSVDDPT